MNESPDQLRIYVKALMRNRSMWSHFAPEEAERRACLLIIELCRSMWASHDGMFVSELEPLFDTLSDIWFTTLRADQVQKAPLSMRVTERTRLPALRVGPASQ